MGKSEIKVGDIVEALEDYGGVRKGELHRVVRVELPWMRDSLCYVEGLGGYFTYRFRQASEWRKVAARHYSRRRLDGHYSGMDDIYHDGLGWRLAHVTRPDVSHPTFALAAADLKFATGPEYPGTDLEGQQEREQRADDLARRVEVLEARGRVLEGERDDARDKLRCLVGARAAWMDAFQEAERYLEGLPVPEDELPY